MSIVLNGLVDNMYCEDAATLLRIFAPNGKLHPSCIGNIQGEVLLTPRI